MKDPDITKKDIVGYEVERLKTERIGQHMFRNNVLDNFGSRCCITGIGNSELLRASHIKPWSKSNEREKVDVSNGLCLEPLMDLVFDKGLITLDDDLHIMISEKLKECSNDLTYEKKFHHLRNSKRCQPKLDIEPKYLRYHRDNIFQTIR